jgi:ABC-type molybdenum transport system ATPase subunit/photorepair protein PhrA
MPSSPPGRHARPPDRLRDAIAKAKAAARTEHAFDREDSPGGLVLENVDVRLPNGQVLIENVNLTVKQGDAVLVRGASGSAARLHCSACWPGSGRSAVGASAARQRAHLLPAAEALPAARYAAPKC